MYSTERGLRHNSIERYAKLGLEEKKVHVKFSVSFNKLCYKSHHSSIELIHQFARHMFYLNNEMITITIFLHEESSLRNFKCVIFLFRYVYN